MDKIAVGYIKKIIPKKITKKLRLYKWKKIHKEGLYNYREGIKCVNKRKRDKTRIVFIISFPETWNSLSSVYSEVVKRKDVETIILAVPKINEVKNEAYNFLIKHNISAVNAYSYEDNEWFNLEKYEPDYVLYTRPYNSEYPEIYRSNKVCKYSKICYVPYAYNMIDGKIFYTTYNHEFILTTYRVFCPNKSRYKRCQDNYRFAKGDEKEKFQYFGYPRFDLLFNNIKTYEIVRENDRKNIIWTPRWIPKSGTDNKKSHFLDYCYDFLNYAEKNKNINLIIRPHPLMFLTLVETGIMSEEDVVAYKNRCNELENVFFDNNSDYMNIIAIADVVVTDYSSLLVEFLIAGNTVIYCDDEKFLNAEGRIVNDALYHAKSFESITNLIEKILSGEDKMQNIRYAAINKLTPYTNGEIGKHIVEYLIDDLNKNRS